MTKNNSGQPLDTQFASALQALCDGSSFFFQALEPLLSASASALSIQRKRLLFQPQILFRLLLMYSLHNLSFRSLACFASSLLGRSVSDEALRTCFCSLEPFLDSMLRSCFASFSPLSLSPSSVQRLLAFDGSLLNQPNSKASRLRLHLTYCYLSQCFSSVSVTTEKTAESLTFLDAKPGDIVLTDSFFGRGSQFLLAQQKGIFLLSRTYLPNVKVYSLDRSPLSNEQLWRSIHLLGITEMEVLIRVKQTKGKYEKLRVRLLVHKLSAKQVKKARKKQRRKVQKTKRTATQKKLNKKRKVSKEASKWAGYVVLITNITAEKMQAKELKGLYTLRWQIETAIKRFKQLLKTKTTKKYSEEQYRIIIKTKLLISFLVGNQATEAQKQIEKKSKAQNKLSIYKITMNLLLQLKQITLQEVSITIEELRKSGTRKKQKKRKYGNDRYQTKWSDTATDRLKMVFAA